MILAGPAAADPSNVQTGYAHAPGDPWERTNRKAYALQERLDRIFIRPIARLFHALAPGPIGKGIHNALTNLSEPVVFANDLMQFRIKRASITIGRLATNSTIGLLGLFDVAERLGLPHHNDDFGVTLGRYGAGPGPYMYVPLVGPTTVRDLIGKGADVVMDPFYWVSYANSTEIGLIRGGVSGLDERVSSEPQLKSILADATDPYATLRSIYLQNRQSQVEGGEPLLQPLPAFDDPSPAAPPAPASAGASPVEDETSARAQEAASSTQGAVSPAGVADLSNPR